MIFKIGGNMDLLEDLNLIWVDVLCGFLMLSFLVFVGCLLWQAIKNKKEQAKILANYERNLRILHDLKNRF